MWQLDADGTFGPSAEHTDALHVAGDAPVEGLPNAGAVVVTFGGTADGRGFSVARQLRALGYGGTLIAAGALIPDQSRHAFQSGFDAILIDDERLARHSETAWRETIFHAVPDLYVADDTSRAGEAGIWARRHAS